MFSQTKIDLLSEERLKKNGVSFINREIFKPDIVSSGQSTQASNYLVKQ
jgi:hypothetical protein